MQLTMFVIASEFLLWFEISIYKTNLLFDNFYYKSKIFARSPAHLLNGLQVDVLTQTYM